MKFNLNTVTALLCLLPLSAVQAVPYFSHTFEEAGWVVGDSIDKPRGNPPAPEWHVRFGNAKIDDATNTAMNGRRPADFAGTPTKMLRLVGGSSPSVEVMRVKQDSGNGENAVYVDMLCRPVAEPAEYALSSLHINGVIIGFVEEKTTSGVQTGYGTVRVADFKTLTAEGEPQWKDTNWRFVFEPGTRTGADWLRITIRNDFQRGVSDLSINGILLAARITPEPESPLPSRSVFFGSESIADLLIDDFSAHATNPLPGDSDNDGLPDSMESAAGRPWAGTAIGLVDPEDTYTVTINGSPVEMTVAEILARENRLSNPFRPNADWGQVTGGVGTVYDTDSDGMPDEWEQFYGLNPASNSDAILDPDRDGLSNLQEFRNNTTPKSFPLFNGFVVNSEPASVDMAISAVKEWFPGSDNGGVWLGLRTATAYGAQECRLVKLGHGAEPLTYSVDPGPNVHFPVIMGISANGACIGNCRVETTSGMVDAVFIRHPTGSYNVFFGSVGGQTIAAASSLGITDSMVGFGTITNTNFSMDFCTFHYGSGGGTVQRLTNNGSPVPPATDQTTVRPALDTASGITADGWVFGYRKAGLAAWRLNLQPGNYQLHWITSRTGPMNGSAAPGPWLAGLSSGAQWICPPVGQPSISINSSSLPSGAGAFEGVVFAKDAGSTPPLRVIRSYNPTTGVRRAFITTAGDQTLGTQLGTADQSLNNGIIEPVAINNAGEITGKVRTSDSSLVPFIAKYGSAKALRDAARLPAGVVVTETNYICNNGDIIASGVFEGRSVPVRLRFVPDTDGDGMSDTFEDGNGLRKFESHDGQRDFDEDGLANSKEFLAGCDPRNADTDGDLIPDGWEFSKALDPADARDGAYDYDGDRLTNHQEYLNQSNPFVSLVDAGANPVSGAAVDPWDIDDGGTVVGRRIASGSSVWEGFRRDGASGNAQYWPNYFPVALEDSKMVGRLVTGSSQQLEVRTSAGAVVTTTPFTAGWTSVTDSYLASGWHGDFLYRHDHWQSGVVTTGTRYWRVNAGAGAEAALPVPGWATSASAVEYMDISSGPASAQRLLTGYALREIAGTWRNEGYLYRLNGAAAELESVVWPGAVHTLPRRVDAAGRILSSYGANSSAWFIWDQGEMEEVNLGYASIIDFNDRKEILFNDVNEGPKLWRNGKAMALRRLLETPELWEKISRVIAINNKGQILTEGPSPISPSIRLFKILKYGDDNNGNGLPEDWEKFHFPYLDNVVASDDDDGDLLTNIQEFERGTDPRSADTDRDGRRDGAEVGAGTDPLQADASLYADTPVINEVCPKNKWDYTNEDGNGTMGWIELYIPGEALSETAFSLEGYELKYWSSAQSESQAVSLKFPASSAIARGGYLLVNACANAEVPAGATSVAGFMRTRTVNGKTVFYFTSPLATTGGRMKLFKTASPANTTHYIEWGTMNTNDSVAMDTDLLRYGHSGKVTPGAANIVEPELLLLDTLNQLGTPHIPYSGVINTPSLTFVFPNDQRLQYVLWTDDSSEPKEGNPHVKIARPGYTNIIVNRTSILRMKGFRGPHEKTAEVMRTYIFKTDVLAQKKPEGISGENNRAYSGPGDIPDPLVPFHFDLAVAAQNTPATIPDELQNLPIVSVGSDPEGLFGKENGIYANSENKGDDWERNGLVEILLPSQLLRNGTPCLLEVMGRISARPYFTRKHSIRLKFRRSAGAASFQLPGLFANATVSPSHTEYDSLVLRSSALDSWSSRGFRHLASYVREQWMHESLRQVADRRENSVPAANKIHAPQPRSRPVHLFLNGLYWGVYYLGEEADENFLRRAWTDVNTVKPEDSDFDVLEDGEVKAGDRVAWDALQAAAFAVRKAAAEGNATAAETNYGIVEGLLHVPQFIDYVLVNLFFENSDWPQSNWVATRIRASQIAGASVHPSHRKFRFIAKDSEAIAGVEFVNQSRLDRFLSAEQPDDGVAALFHNLTGSLAFRQAVITRSQALFATGATQTKSDFNARLTDAAGAVRPGMRLEAARWGGLPLTTQSRGPVDFENQITWLRNWLLGLQSEDPSAAFQSAISSYLSPTPPVNQSHPRFWDALGAGSTSGTAGLAAGNAPGSVASGEVDENQPVLRRWAGTMDFRFKRNPLRVMKVEYYGMDGKLVTRQVADSDISVVAPFKAEELADGNLLIRSFNANPGTGRDIIKISPAGYLDGEIEHNATDRDVTALITLPDNSPMFWLPSGGYYDEDGRWYYGKYSSDSDPSLYGNICTAFLQVSRENGRDYGKLHVRIEEEPDNSFTQQALIPMKPGRAGNNGTSTSIDIISEIGPGGLVDPNAWDESEEDKLGKLWKFRLEANGSGRMSAAYSWIEGVFWDADGNWTTDADLTGLHNGVYLGVAGRRLERFDYVPQDPVKSYPFGTPNPLKDLTGYFLTLQGRPLIWRQGQITGSGSIFDKSETVDTANSTIHSRFEAAVRSEQPFRVAGAGKGIEVYGVRRKLRNASNVLYPEPNLADNQMAEYKLSITAENFEGERVAFHNVVLKDTGVPSAEWSDQSGYRFRQINISGQPIPSAKEQAKPESDEAPEETQVDSLTLQLRHDCSDIYIPAAGGELALAVKRSVRPEVWSDRGSVNPATVYPGEAPFGPCWSSGLGCHLRIEEGVNIEEMGAARTPEMAAEKAMQDRVRVVDENGQVHEFYAITVPSPPLDPSAAPANKLAFVPVVSCDADADSWLNQLSLRTSANGDFKWFEFTRKFGTAIRFPVPSVPLEKWICTDNSGKKYRRLRFYRPAEIEDRFHTVMTYRYLSGNLTLVPDSIVEGRRLPGIAWHLNPASELRELRIARDERGQVTAVSDPRGNTWRYEYGADLTGAPGPAIIPLLLKSVTTPRGDKTNYAYNGAATTALPNPFIPIANRPSFQHLNIGSIETLDFPAGRQNAASLPSSPRTRTTHITYGFEKSCRYGGYDGSSALVLYDPAVSKPRVVTSISVTGMKTGEPNHTRTTTWNQRLSGDGLPTNRLPAAVPLTGPVSLKENPAGGYLIDGHRLVEVLDSAGGSWYYVYDQPILSEGAELADLASGEVPRNRVADPVIRWKRCRLFYPTLDSTLADRLVDTVEFNPAAGMADAKVTDASGNITEYVYDDAVDYDLVQPWFAPLQRLLESRNSGAGTVSALKARMAGGDDRLLPAKHGEPTREIRLLKNAPGDAAISVYKDFRYYGGAYDQGGNTSPYKNGVAELTPLMLPRETRLRSPLARVMVESYGPYNGALPAAQHGTEAVYAVTLLDHDRGVPSQNATVWRHTVGASTQVFARSWNTYGDPLYPAFVTQLKEWSTIRSDGNVYDRTTSFASGHFGNVEVVSEPVSAVVSPQSPPITTTATTTTRVDMNGNTEFVTDPLNQTTSYVYDKENRLIKTVYPDCGRGAEVRETEYDNRGRKIWERDEEGLQTLYIFGADGKLKHTVRDMNGDGLMDSGDLTVTREYDIRGRLIKSTDARGTVTRTTYDNLHRPLHVWTDIDNDGTWDRTPTGNGSNLEAGVEKYYGDNAGRFGQNQFVGSAAFASGKWTPTRSVEFLKNMTDTGSWQLTALETKTTLDSFYRVTKVEKQVVAGPTPKFLVTKTSYDLAGRIAKVVSPNGQTVTYTRDPQGNARTETEGYDDAEAVAAGDPAALIDDSSYPAYKVTAHAFAGPTKYRSHVVVSGQVRGSETDYDAGGRPWRIYGPDANGSVNRAQTETASPLTETWYDLAGRPVAVQTPPMGITWTEYDARGRQVKIVAPPAANAGGLSATTLPAVQGSLPSASAVSTTRYFRNGLVDETVDARGLRTVYQYNKAGLPIKTVSGLSASVARGPFDALSAIDSTPTTPVTEIPTAPTVLTVTRALYDKSGNVLVATDADGLATYNAFDEFNRLISTYTNPAGPPIPGATALTVPASPPADAIVVRTQYDSRGNVVEVKDGADQITRFLYDGADRKIKLVVDPDHARKKVESFEYAGGLLWKVTKPDGTIRTIVYDRLARPIRRVFSGHPIHTEATTYDIWGQVTAVDYPDLPAGTERTLKKSEMRYNKGGRLIAEIAGGVQSRYTYNRAGAVTQVDYGHPGSASIDTVPWPAASVRRTIANSYDVLGRLQSLSETGPDPGEPNNAVGTRTSRYYYSVAGDLVRKVQAGGQYTHQTYDVRGRILNLETWQYDGSPPAIAVAASAMKYRHSGAVAEVQERRGASVLRTVSNLYDRAWRQTKETSVPSAGSPVTVTEFEYDKANNRTRKKVTVAGTLVNNIVSGFNRPSLPGFNASGANSNQIVNCSDAVTGDARLFTYDGNGNRLTERWIPFNPGPNAGDLAEEKRYYQWDGDNRLLECKVETSDSQALVGLCRAPQSFTRTTHRYHYDYRTRRVMQSTVSQVGPEANYAAYSSTPADVRSNASYQPTYTYQARGSVQSGGLGVQDYNLSAITSGGVFQSWSSYGATQLPEAEYVRGSDLGGGVGSILYSLRPAIGARYQAYNQRGDVVAQTDRTGAGTVTWAAAYDAFGKRIAGYETGSTADRQKANTHDEDATGLINDGFRYRDAVTGTYLSRDPLGFVDGPNVYTYVRQNPWTFFDAEGLEVTGEEKGQLIRDNTTGETPGVNSHIAANLEDPADDPEFSQKNPYPIFHGATRWKMLNKQTVKLRDQYFDQKIEETMTNVALVAGTLAGAAVIAEALPILAGAISPAAVVGAAKEVAGELVEAQTGIPVGGIKDALEAAGKNLGKNALKALPTEQCFVAGTLIATAEGGQAIETIQVGKRVLTGNGGSSTEVDPKTWRLISLKITNPKCEWDIFDIQLLRSSEWIAEIGCKSGAKIWIELEELGVKGWSSVEKIENCPPISQGEGRLVLATVTHHNAFVLELKLAGEVQTLRPTDRHPLFSATRDKWVSAGEIRAGEQLRTANGMIMVTSIRSVPGIHRVFNLEVESEHNYYAGEAEVLSHNTCIDNVERLAGSGPAPGVLEVSPLVKSTKAFQNYKPGAATEFVFDPATNRFVVGRAAGAGSPHQRLAATIGGSKSMVGGMFRRGSNGEMLTNEFSGHYWQNWTPEVRSQFQNFMKNAAGQKMNHTPGM